MFRKIALVALLIALVAATVPTGQQCPAIGCHFSTTNLIVNGGFENPQVPAWDYFSTIQGWATETDKIQIGKGHCYNTGSLSVGENQVAELVSDKSTRLYQVLKLSATTYLLKFNYQCRSNVQPYQCALNLYWNNELILNLRARDYNVRTSSVVVVADQGDNRITFQGVDDVYRLGIVIDNVELYQRNDWDSSLAAKQAFFEAVWGNIKKGRECPLC